MSTEENVPMSMFKEQMTNVLKFMEALAEQSEKDQKRNQAELDTITNLSQRVENLETNTNRILQYLQGGQQQQQQQEPQQGQIVRPRLDLNELASVAREAASAYREVKSTMTGEGSELDRWGMAFAEIAKREALSAMKLNVRRGLRKGIVDVSTIESIVGEKIDSHLGTGGGHEPVL